MGIKNVQANCSLPVSSCGKLTVACLLVVVAS